jgi:seryl-tRNA synthetase
MINYGLEFLYNRGYQPNAPPYMMLRDQMAKTAQLEQFDEELYKVTEKENDPTSEKYLIATSEQPLSVLVSIFHFKCFTRTDFEFSTPKNG